MVKNTFAYSIIVCGFKNIIFNCFKKYEFNRNKNKTNKINYNKYIKIVHLLFHELKSFIFGYACVL